MKFFQAIFFAIVALCGNNIIHARLHGSSSSLENEEAPKDLVVRRRQQQQQRKVAEDDQPNNNNKDMLKDDLMEYDDEEADLDHHRQLGSWQIWTCNRGTNKGLEKLDKNEYKVTGCKSKSSAATKKDALKMAELFCGCSSGQYGNINLFQIKSYKTIFGTRDWYYRCC